MSGDSPTLKRESSLGLEREASDLTESEKNGPGYGDEYYDHLEALPPGRMHATTRSTAEIRLRSSMPNLPGFMISGDSSVGSSGSGSNRRTKSNSASLLLLDNYPHSPRSKSPLLRSTVATTSAGDGNSSISSLEDIVDADILYDRVGALADCSDVLSASSASEKRSKSRELFVNLPPVNERMTEDTLEDVHAFSDVKVTTSSGSNASRTSIATSSVDGGDKLQLDPLMEDDDEEEDADNASLEDPSEADYYEGMPPVILTNMENLDLQAQQEENEEQANEEAGDTSNYESGGGLGEILATSSSQQTDE